MTIRAKLFFLCGFSTLLSTSLFLLNPRGSCIGALVQVLTGHAVADSSYYMNRAWQTVHLDVPLYRVLFFQQHFKFVYPTSSLLVDFVADRIHLSVTTLISSIVALSALLTLYFAGECFLILCPQTTTDRAYTLPIRLAVALLGVLFYPIVQGAALGQIQTLLTLLFTVAVWFWIQDRKQAAGCAIAFICIFKPPLLLFLVWAIVRREWRFLIAFLATTLSVQLLSGCLFGWGNEFGYLQVVTYLSRHGEIIPDNQSVNGLLERWLHNGDPSYWTATSAYPAFNRLVYTATVCSSAVLLGFALLAPVVRRIQSTVPDFIVFGLASTMASPIVWTHYYGMFFIGSVVFLALRLNHHRKIPLSFLIAFFLLSVRWIIPASPAERMYAVLSTPDLFAGLVVLGWIAALPVFESRAGGYRSPCTRVIRSKRAAAPV
jgi:hypothetical protein